MSDETNTVISGVRAGRSDLDLLLTLPPAMAAAWAEQGLADLGHCRVSSDPPGGYLGSGGATAHVLHEAWKAEGAPDWDAWLAERRRIIWHGGGQSRRLPAYAVVGKLLLPLPVLRWSRGQRLNQTLLEVQLPEYARLLQSASASTVTMVASGDVLVQPGQLPSRLPEADVVGIGIPLPPEVAAHFGVFFLSRSFSESLACFLQKPAPDRIREMAGEYVALADSGLWLLSARAVRVLMAKAGGDGAGEITPGWRAAPYELYAGFGLALGTEPTEPDAEIADLSVAVLGLADAEFFHLGTSRQMIEAVSELHNRGGTASRRRGAVAAWGHPDQHLQNSRFDLPLRRQANHTLWVENSSIPSGWRLASEHVLTNVPPNEWNLRLETGVCLDFIPVGEREVAVRFYGIDDTFRGAIGSAATRLLGRPVTEWLAARGLDYGDAGLNPESDLQEVSLFPVTPAAMLSEGFLEWLFAAAPASNDGYRAEWLGARRLAASDLVREANVERLLQQRRENCHACLVPLMRNAAHSVFFQLDLESTARLLATAEEATTEVPVDPGNPMQSVRAEMVRAAVLRWRERAGADAAEETAFVQLRDLVESRARLSPVAPHRRVLRDQIVWGRSPVRLDLAGGWTDTPPYLLENGGKVVNLAVDLNGQPPLQVFVRVSERPELVIRSIDLGTEQRIRTYEELDTFAQPGSAFALAQAAFALAGFLPRFHANGGYPSLEAQLRDWGGGVEISLLAAVPKGSGLGTSSILAATLLATLGDLCGLGWDRQDLFAHTLILEQMVTTGGGWQDQAGGLFRGIKLIETAAGLEQRPTLRWLPDHLFSETYANRTILLYYTGLTRMARGILHEVVRGVFLNSPRHLEVLGCIHATAGLAFNALQEADYGRLCRAVQQSWRFNQELDAGTNPPQVQAILKRVEDLLLGAKLLGAGGGGYLLMLAKDPEAAVRVRSVLEQAPPNDGARFVEFSISNTGLQLTRS